MSEKETLPAEKPTSASSASEVGIGMTGQQVSRVGATQPRAAMTKAAMDELTIVRSSADGLARNPRIKRMMTEQELEQYQLRRVIGACKVCKSTKRKVCDNIY